MTNKKLKESEENAKDCLLSTFSIDKESLVTTLSPSVKIIWFIHLNFTKQNPKAQLCFFNVFELDIYPTIPLLCQNFGFHENLKRLFAISKIIEFYNTVLNDEMQYLCFVNTNPV